MPLAVSAVVREPTVTVIARPQFVEPPQLPILWMGEATEGERLTEFGGRLRHMSQGNPAERTTRDYLEHLLVDGASALNHAHYSLLLEGVSQSLLHELAQHHAGLSVTQQSLRYRDETTLRFVVPPAIVGDEAAELTWTVQMNASLDSYVALVSAMMTRFVWINDKVLRRKVARDAACSVLPACTDTSVLVTGSAAEWRLMLARRTREGEELEIRRLAIAVLRVMCGEVPALFGDAQIYVAVDRRDAARFVATHD